MRESRGAHVTMGGQVLQLTRLARKGAYIDNGLMTHCRLRICDILGCGMEGLRNLRL